MAIDMATIGNKRYAMIPMDEYEDMMDDLQDMQEIGEILEIHRQIKTGEMPTYPASVVNALINGVNPVKVYREHKGLTQQELADKIGKSVAMIRKIENGESEASVSTMKAIANVLDTDVDSLI